MASQSAERTSDGGAAIEGARVVPLLVSEAHLVHVKLYFTGSSFCDEFLEVLIDDAKHECCGQLAIISALAWRNLVLTPAWHLHCLLELLVVEASAHEFVFRANSISKEVANDAAEAVFLEGALVELLDNPHHFLGLHGLGHVDGLALVFFCFGWFEEIR